MAGEAGAGGATGGAASAFVGSSTGVPITEAGAGATTPPAAGGEAGTAAAAGAAAEQAKPRVLATDLPPDALKRRLDEAAEKAARDARAALLAELGVDDPGKIKSEREKLRALEEAEEKRKREAMSREEQLAADLEKAKKDLETAQARTRELEESQITQAQESVVQAAALKYVDPDMYAYARQEFVAHVNALLKDDPKKVEEMGPNDVERFFRVLVRKKPKLALAASSTPAAGSTTPAAPKPSTTTSAAGATPPAPQRPAATSSATPSPAAATKPPVRRPVTNGAPPAKGAPPPARTSGAPDMVGGKTFRPGQANSMNRGELNAALRKQGIKPW